MFEVVLILGLGAGAAGVAIWSALKKSAQAPLEKLPPPELPKKVPLTLGDRVLDAIATKYALRNEVDSVTGRVAGIEIQFSAKPDGAAPTQFLASATFPAPLGLELDVGASNSISPPDGEPIVSVEFDSRFSIEAAHLDQARALLSGLVAEQLILAHQRDFHPRLDDERLRFSVQAAAGEARAKLAADNLIEIAQAIRVARGNVPRPEVELRALAAFDGVAAARGGVVRRASNQLVIDDEIGRLEVVFASSGRSYETRFDLELARPIALELGIGLESERSNLERWRHPDIQLGDAAFDEKFLVRGESEERVRTLIGDKAKQALFELAKRVNRLEIEPKSISVALRRSIDHASELGALIDAMLSVGEALCPRVDRGAYR